ncbi:MAG TPA: hypothetical protein PKI12_08010 [Bacteroidales bacterium]|nr:hypothetical protein [Bacteroidales bacterium]
MPDKEAILSGLQKIVNDYSIIAIIWHILFYALVVALIAKWLPSNRFLALLFCLPVLSVAVMAFMTGNPFNGILFSLLTLLLFIFGLRATVQPLQVSQIIFMVIGILMIVFGLFYPHFTQGDSFMKYFYASPAGLIPCPTLSIIIGFLLLYNGLGSQAITLLVVIYGLFYGLFGTLRLAVYPDIFLIFGSVSLLVKYVLSLRG